MLTLSHGNTYIKIHDPATLWVKSESTSGFEACVREAGSGSSGASVISWLAFQGSYQGIYSGIVGFDEFTSRTQCKQISLSSQTKVSYHDYRAKLQVGQLFNKDTKQSRYRWQKWESSGTVSNQSEHAQKVLNKHENLKRN